MARILGIDYGTRRVGIATTDPLQIIVSGLDTVPTAEIIDYLTKYIGEEEVEKIVVGDPLQLDGRPGRIAHLIVGFVRQLNKLFPEIDVVTHDERFSSFDAKAVILKSGAKKKKRRDKALIDKVAAVLILQNYLGH